MMQILPLIDDFHRRYSGRYAVGSTEPVVMGDKNDGRAILASSHDGFAAGCLLKKAMASTRTERPTSDGNSTCRMGTSSMFGQ
ncbi:hypothetical protein [Nitrospira calida]